MSTEERSVADRAAATAAVQAKVIVVMPARNAARTLERPFRRSRPTWSTRSSWSTTGRPTARSSVARRLPLHLIWHPHNVGYGGNQKTCYLEALQRGADVVVMLHPDGQYEPSLIPELVEPIIDGEADMVLGSRLTRARALARGGMPRYKFLANRGLTTVENLRARHRSFASCTRATGRTRASCC